MMNILEILLIAALLKILLDSASAVGNIISTIAMIIVSAFIFGALSLLGLYSMIQHFI